MKIFMITLLMFLGYVLLTGWALMMAIGVVHHEWIPACPTIGFGWSIMLAFFVRLSMFQWGSND